MSRSSFLSSNFSRLSLQSRSCKHRRQNHDEHRHRYHRHQHHHQKEYNFTWVDGSSPFMSSTPTPSERIIARVRKGKFVQFDVLLSSTSDAIPVQAARSTNQKKPSSHKQKATNFQSWMEAWNIFLLIRSHTSPHLCLELLKF